MKEEWVMLGPAYKMYIGYAALFAVIAVVAILKRRSANPSIVVPPTPWGAPGVPTGHASTIPYTYHYFPGTRKRSPYLTITVHCFSKGEFRISRENPFDSLGKHLGISCEIQTGDAEFDSRFYVDTNSVNFTNTVLMDTAKRAAVREIFALGVSEVKHDGKTLTATLRPYHQQPEAAFMAQVADAMAKLGGVMPDYMTEPALAGMAVWKVNRALVIGVSALLLAASVIAAAIVTYPLMDGKALFVYSLKYSLPVLAVFLFLAFALLRGRSSSHRELGIAAVLAVAGCLIMGYTALEYFNGAYDMSPVVTRRMAVLAKNYSRSDNSTTYYALIESWREGRTQEKLVVTRGEYDRLVPMRSRMTVYTRAGRLGFEWRAGYQIESN